jgi:ssRNA-specific RNase YbeY (16S rRNA maturation enzyme)
MDMPKIINNSKGYHKAPKLKICFAQSFGLNMPYSHKKIQSDLDKLEKSFHLVFAYYHHLFFFSPTKNWTFSIYFCGDKKMKNLNAKHRKKDYPTDVLSFPSHFFSGNFFHNQTLNEKQKLYTKRMTPLSGPRKILHPSFKVLPIQWMQYPEWYLGDVLVNIAQAKRQITIAPDFLGEDFDPRDLKNTKTFKHKWWLEIVQLIIHGCVHIFGFDHELSSEEEKIMAEIEWSWWELWLNM